jgi:HD-like signal output (HDOD) protein
MNAHATSPADTRALIIKAASTLGVLRGGTQGAQQLLALLCDPDVNAGQVADALSREPALALRVLRVANSAFYGASRNIATVERAVALLGQDSVRGIAAAACLDRTVRLADAAAPLDLDELVQHGFAVAVAAESLARHGHGALAADAFIAGLLHDLGIAVQISIDQPGANALIEALRSHPDQGITDLECERVRVGHAQCAAVLFEAWQLPLALVEVARWHHAPLGAPAAHRELAALVHLGDQLALAGGTHHALEPQAPPRNAAVMELLGLDDGDLDGVAAALPERLSQLREAFAAS